MDGGACTDGAEESFSRMRRAEIGHHHPIARQLICLVTLGKPGGARIASGPRTANR
jgi:hypothetical protein